VASSRISAWVPVTAWAALIFALLGILVGAWATFPRRGAA
jgi:hypothetical protein